MLRAVAAARVRDAADDSSWPESAIGTGVEKGVHLMRDNSTIAFDASFQPQHRRMPRRAGDELFAVFHDHFHRPAGTKRKQIANWLVNGSALAAEVAADRHGMDAHSLRSDLEGIAHALFQSLRRFVWRPHLHALLFVDPNQAAMRLQKCLVYTRHRKSILDNQISSGKTGIDIPAVKHVVSKTIGWMIERLRKSFISGDVWMNDRRAFLQRHLRIEYRRKFFVMHVDQLESALGLLERVRRDRGDALAHKPRALLSQNGNIPIAPAVKNARIVFAGQHGAYTLSFFGSRRVNADNPSVRVRTAQGLRPQSSGQQHICRVTRLTRHFARIVGPRYRLSDYMIIHVGLFASWSTVGVLLLHTQYSTTPSPRCFTDIPSPDSTSPRRDEAESAADISRYHGRDLSSSMADHRRPG